ncbi:MAG: hypothetical protein AB2669_14135 [Candidatus Thiodiazotropha endolucinida]|nr:hypothetical protein [Candidatus Thiodiazotropha taylori]MCW4226896.1 hypothetical protein [Candidatus Thiodiazotropha endolucinida]MCG7881142.1 hypothetical protein [Candidatus Thiodiazotropha taylori]MCG7888458.1 hypothetical protein [Candidatus Thiodiazotropha taylori]MCG7889366.1 hypothetical protein [Candidatus Thiodiazotropha taylori]
MPQTITNDHDLREAISGLSPVEQRALGGQFVANVGHLSQDPRISRAIDAAIDSDISPAELEQIHKTVKAFATQTYTACGSDADWAAQAEHFVAAAAAASLSSDDQSGARGAWKAAMQARMAKNCEMILIDDGGIANESEKQYQMTGRYLEGLEQ